MALFRDAKQPTLYGISIYYLCTDSSTYKEIRDQKKKKEIKTWRGENESWIEKRSVGIGYLLDSGRVLWLIPNWGLILLRFEFGFGI